jgi:FkbH-like protein
MTEFFAQEFRKHFGVYNLTADDKNKSAQYEYKAKSEQLRAQAANEDEFIKQLRIKIVCEEMNQNNSERIAQLINKSNQFNLTTRRYEKNELVGMDNATILAIRVLDKFGDLGITGVAIAVKDGPDTARIDTFLMSCRVLGRKIEKEFLKIVLNRLYQDGVHMVNSEYIKTRKNALVQSFYDENGFRRVGEDGDIISYSYKLDKPVEYNKNYRIEVKNERQD